MHMLRASAERANSKLYTEQGMYRASKYARWEQSRAGVDVGAKARRPRTASAQLATSERGAEQGMYRASARWRVFERGDELSCGWVGGSWKTWSPKVVA